MQPGQPLDGALQVVAGPLGVARHVGAAAEAHQAVHVPRVAAQRLVPVRLGGACGVPVQVQVRGDQGQLLDGAHLVGGGGLLGGVGLAAVGHPTVGHPTVGRLTLGCLTLGPIPLRPKFLVFETVQRGET